MAHAFECAFFGTLVAANLALGLYFSLRSAPSRANTGVTKVEVFLGSRTLRYLPLAASSVASLFSSTGLIGFPAHFYAYGWHVLWLSLTPLLLFPLATRLFVPLLYKLGVTSIFEYLRFRFNASISLTACVIYIILTQSIGAISIFAAALTLVTAFHVPLLWCIIGIGFSGTFYTAMGGLRGVVWTGCMQFLFIIVAQATVIANIVVGSLSPGSMVQPLGDMNLWTYIGNFSFDLTSDENVWACLVGSSAIGIYRLCLDQVVTQRLLASRTMNEAKRTAFTGALLLVLLYCLCLSMGVSLTVWFRGCDPELLGVIKSIDQILPYYINTYLVHIPGFVGLFLAGVVCAATSTISSTINSQATIIYVDVISHHFKNAEQHVLWITRCTALILGVIMTLYSTLCIYVGSLTKVFLMVYASITATFVGLCLLAALFPFVHSKGAGVANSVTAAFQLWHITHVIQSGKTPPRMPVSLDYCSGNHTSDTLVSNSSDVLESNASRVPFSLLDMSPLWSSFFTIFATILIGVLVSAVTGEIKRNQAQSSLCSDALVRFWRNLSKPTKETKIVVRLKSSSSYSRQYQDTLTSFEGETKFVSEAEKLLMLKEEAQV